jgi:hypothetical protein
MINADFRWTIGNRTSNPNLSNITDTFAKKLWDAFISHASEDKEKFVRPLAHKLTLMNVKVWYDEFTLKVGDSLSEKINEGLSKSDYGIVVLSKNFFNKKWPRAELEALETKAVNSGRKTILPIWLDITKEEVAEYSPIMANRYALQSTEGIDTVAQKLAYEIKNSRI